MADVTHSKIDDLDALDGYFEKVSMVQVAAGLGISAFGISIVDLDPGADEYPEHDHSEDGLGGEMFAKRPQQLGQEEVYVAPSVKRKVTPGPDGLRLLALGATPGEAYDTGGTL
jgi:hypothetical protein